MKVACKYAVGKESGAQVAIDETSDITAVDGAVLLDKEDGEGWDAFLGRYKGAFSELSSSVILFESCIIILC